MPAASSTSSSSINPRCCCTRSQSASAATVRCNAVSVERSGDVGRLAGLLQHHALKRDDFLVEREIRAGHQRRIQRLFDVGMIDGMQVDVGQEAVEPVRHHAFEQRRLVGDQAIQRLGGDPGPARHRLHAGRGITAGGEFVPRGLIDDLAGLVVGADLRPAPAAPVLRRSPAASVGPEAVRFLAMLLHDACHSIDSPNIGSILENIKFPNYRPPHARPAGAAMTRHSTAFEIERPVPAADAAKDLLPPHRRQSRRQRAGRGSVQPKKFNFRKMLMAGAAVAALAGAAWYGWDYWTVGQYLVSTDDAYVKADNTTIAPKVSGYLQRGAGRRQ